jgi:hypothetical protein
MYEECFNSPVFVVAGEGNIATLRCRRGLRPTSPFVRTTSGISLLESAAISVLQKLKSWWYNDALFEDIAVRGKAQGKWLRGQYHLIAGRKFILGHVYLEQRRVNLFDTIEFRISLGPRLAGTLWILFKHRYTKQIL